MAELIGDKLTDDLWRRLEGADLKVCAEKVILVSTVDAHGWPHPAMLSYLEVVAKDRSNIRIAAYKESTTTNNLRRNGRCTLLIIDERAAYYIKGRVEELKPEMRCAPHNSMLNLRVDQVLSDQADERLESGVQVAGGITYEDPNIGARLQNARAVLEELLG